MAVLQTVARSLLSQSCSVEWPSWRCWARAICQLWIRHSADSSCSERRKEIHDSDGTVKERVVVRGCEGVGVGVGVGVEVGWGVGVGVVVGLGG